MNTTLENNSARLVRVTAITAALLLVGAVSTSAGATNAVHHACCSACKETVENTKVSASTQLSGQSLYQLDSTWTNDFGATIKLASLRGRPQVVAMFFANCTYACPLLVYQMQQIEASLPEPLRKEVGFVLVSFDTERDTPAALHQYRVQHGLAGDRWTLLRGNPDDVLELANLLNVKFKKDAQGQFLHSNVLSLLNADGELVYQQVGLNPERQELVQRAETLAKK